MIKLPDFRKAFEYENNFYLSCDISRIRKILAQYELYKMSRKISGDIIECGVFKGTSFARFSIFRELFQDHSKKIIGFDVFGKFPTTKFSQDKKIRKQFINSAGENSISQNQLIKVLKHKKTQQLVELIKGDITKTIPNFVHSHKKLKISLLNLDTDIYEPAVTILEYLYPKISKGGILILDDYGVFPGETKAVDDYFKGKKIKIQNLPFTTTCYIVK